MPDIDSIIQREVEKRHQVTQPTGRDFPDPLKYRYISVSFLVKESAEKYAQSLLGLIGGNSVPPYYGFRGNALCDALLREITPHRELSVEGHGLLPEGWYFSGHPDGLTVTPEGYLLCDEVKSHIYLNEQQQEIARRQDELYLALILHEYERNGNKLTLETSQYGDDACEPLVLENIRTDGAFLMFDNLGAHEPVHECEFIPRARLLQTLQFYVDKAGDHILRSLAEGNLDAAREWERGGPGATEFTRYVPHIYDGPSTEPLSRFLTSKFQADELYKQSEAERKASQQEAIRLLREEGLEETTVGDYRVKVIGGFDGARTPWLRVNRIESEVVE